MIFVISIEKFDEIDLI